MFDLEFVNMKKNVITFSSALFVILIWTINAQSIESSYQVGLWHGFRLAAITYTFDDGCPGQFSHAIPIFNEFGFKATLYTVTGWVGDWSNQQNAASQGHEIASHTMSHTSLADLNPVDQENELRSSANSSLP